MARSAQREHRTLECTDLTEEAVRRHILASASRQTHDSIPGRNTQLFIQYRMLYHGHVHHHATLKTVHASTAKLLLGLLP